MLVQTAFRAVGLGAVLDGAWVVPTNFGRGPPMPLSFFIRNIESYSERVLVRPLIALEAVEFELEVFLFVKELLESVSQDDVCVVEAAVLLIKLVILISTILLLFCLKLGDARRAHFL